MYKKSEHYSISILNTVHSRFFRVEIVRISISLEPMRCREGLFCVRTESIWPACLRCVEQRKETTAADFLLVKRWRDFVTKKRSQFRQQSVYRDFVVSYLRTKVLISLVWLNNIILLFYCSNISCVDIVKKYYIHAVYSIDSVDQICSLMCYIL